MKSPELPTQTLSDVPVHCLHHPAHDACRLVGLGHLLCFHHLTESVNIGTPRYQAVLVTQNLPGYFPTLFPFSNETELKRFVSAVNEDLGLTNRSCATIVASSMHDRKRPRPSTILPEPVPDLPDTPPRIAFFPARSTLDGKPRRRSQVAALFLQTSLCPSFPAAPVYHGSSLEDTCHASNILNRRIGLPDDYWLTKQFADIPSR